MSKFEVEILTPRREFFSGMAEAVTFVASDGEMTVLKDRAPMLAALEIGPLKMKVDGAWRVMFISEGFVEVRPDKVLIFTQACENADEIDVVRAEEERERAVEALRQKRSRLELSQTQISLTRAMTRIQISQKYGE